MSKYVDGVNEENMDSLLAALRSGEYEQATGVLCNAETGGYCCLGVASEVAWKASEGLVGKTVRVINPEYTQVSYDDQRLLAPESVMNWLGIPAENRDADGIENGFNIRFYKSDFNGFSDGYVSATEMNDDMGLSFVDIANAFEAEFTKEV